MFRLGSPVLFGVVVALALSAPASAGLPSVASGPRPGPDVLYAEPAPAPQLENAGPWRAEPILVSGAAAYRDGEFLYQDFLHDDRGARYSPDPSDPHGASDFTFSPKAGTVTYPTDPVYANNAADLVELRIRALPSATAFRVTLNTLQDAGRTGFTIALGSSEAARQWPHGAGVASPAQYFLTVHGESAELLDAATGEARTPAPTATVDGRRRQVEVRVPHAAFDPGRSAVRTAIGVGLWDPAAGRYLQPQPGEATATTPGGGAPAGAALFNVGPRLDEPMPDVDATGGGITMGDAAAGAYAQAYWWREFAQAEALALGDVSRFSVDVDFGKLRDGARDESRVPKTGPMSRILASRFAFGQGIDYTKPCFDLGGGAVFFRPCEGMIRGQLQPYAVYVPAKPRPERGYGFTFLLHSLSANYNQYLDSKHQSQLGERGTGSIVATPSARGPDGFYIDYSEADAFEVWADVARHYELDPEYVAISGYSMGGIGTYRLMARWPDLFARGFSVVGSPQPVDAKLESLRNTPFMAWAAAADELVHVTETEEAQQRLGALGYRYVANLFETADHLTLATNDEWRPGAEFLGEHRVDRDPPHVTYVVDATDDHAAALVVADHAYWIGGVRARDGKGEGTIDARSEGFGVADSLPSGVQVSQGALTGGSHGPMPYLQRVQDWGTAPPAAKDDRIIVRATGVAAATIDTRRARLSCSPAVDLRSDGPLDLRFSCPEARRPRCSRTVTVRLPRVKGRRITRARATRNGRTIKVKRGRNLRRIVVRRPTRRAFSLRVRATTTRRGRITVVRRYAPCGS